MPQKITVSLKEWCEKNNKEELLKQWDVNKNGELKPENIAYGSNKKHYWICDKGHSWMQSPNARTLRGCNCPYCANQIVLKGFNDLETLSPELAKEWDYDKNELKPSQVLNGTAKKYWWKCSNNHSWLAVPSQRRRGRGCPYCSSRKVLSGYNDLMTTHPNIAKEWDFQKNEGVLPTMVSHGNGKKYWWKCSNNHSYMATINNRASGNGCPYCSGKKVYEGYNDFKSWCIANHQERMLDEWNYEKNIIKPTEISVKSHKMIWWKCSFCGNEWKTVISSRTRKLNIFGCKKCATNYSINLRIKERALKGESINDTFPKIAQQWDYHKNGEILPTEVLANSSKKYWWICDKGHSFYTSAYLRTNQKIGCPYCSNHAVIVGENDLLTKKPELCTEWNYQKNGELKPNSVVENSHMKAWWKCNECGYEWQAVISSRVRGNGCPKCAKEKQTSFPEQAILFYINNNYKDAINGDKHLGFELDIYIPSIKIGIEYDGQAWHKNLEKDIRKNELCIKNGIKLFRIREIGCPEILEESGCKVLNVRKNDIGELENAIKTVCEILGIPTNIDIERDRAEILAQYRNSIKEKSLATKYPLLLDIWDYDKNIILPSHISHGSNVKVWWKCLKGHSYQASVSSRVKGHGCPICSGYKVLSGENDFLSWCKNNNRMELLDEWDYNKNVLKPTEIPKGSKKEIWWMCKNGHSYMSYTYNRIRGVGCPVCAGKKIVPGFNDLGTLYPELLKDWDYEKNTENPMRIAGGSNKKAWWKCHVCGHEWETMVYSRTKRKAKCPKCSKKK